MELLAPSKIVRKHWKFYIHSIFKAIIWLLYWIFYRPSHNFEYITENISNSKIFPCKLLFSSSAYFRFCIYFHELHIRFLNQIIFNVAYILIIVFWTFSHFLFCHLMFLARKIVNIPINNEVKKLIPIIELMIVLLINVL